MKIKQLAKMTEKTLVDNSPLIMTALGVAGTITTAYLTGKASFNASTELRAARIFRENDEIFKAEAAGKIPYHEPFTTREKIEVIWKLYIPALGVGVGTITCIILANRIGTRRAAAMAAAYTITEKAFTEYREKVVEHMGKQKEQKVRDEIAQEHTNRAMEKSPVIITGTGESLCLDKWTGRMWPSTMETLKKAQNDLNYQILNEGFASLNEFYSKVGLDHIPTGEEVGWNSDKGLMELSFSTTIAQDRDGAEKPCLVMEFYVEPLRGFYKWR